MSSNSITGIDIVDNWNEPIRNEDTKHVYICTICNYVSKVESAFVKHNTRQHKMADEVQKKIPTEQRKHMKHVTFAKQYAGTTTFVNKNRFC